MRSKTPLLTAARRRRPMRVLALGLPRTGTCSLRKALEILCYHNVYHGYTAALDRPENSKLWLEAFRARDNGTQHRWTSEDFDRILGDFEAVTDIPAACFWKELIEAYPEAKVVLTERDIDDWYNSVNSALISSFTMWSSCASFLATITLSSRRWVWPMFDQIFQGYFAQFAVNGKHIYKQHYTAVESALPDDRLLIFQVGDGWAPLCAFLGHQIPDCPFPNENDKEATRVKIRTLVVWEAVKAFGKVSVVISVAVLIMRIMV